MTIEHAPGGTHSTNGRVHTNDTQPAEPRAYESPGQADQQRGGGVSRFVMPLVLMIVALVIVRRLNAGNEI
jgi:hypothetical protein